MFDIFKKKDINSQAIPKEISVQLKGLQQQTEKLSSELTFCKKQIAKAVTKIGIVRFNPFQEIGSDQSFSVALLDQENDGLVITSHYMREYNRVYAKPIKNGQSEYSLSEEEREAIENAMKEKSTMKSSK